MNSRRTGGQRRALRATPIAAVGLASLPAAAHAHAGAPALPHDAFTAWSLEPLVILPLALLAAGYLRGVRTLRVRTGREWPVPRWRVWCHWAGWGALVLALVSPVDAIGEAIFAGHMVQHLLLTMVAAPLLVLGDAWMVLLWALPSRGRRAVGGLARMRVVRGAWRAISAPLAAWTLHVAAIIAWHVPWLYEAAVRNDAVHALEHASFFLTAVLFWRPLAAARARQRLTFGPSLLYLFTGALASTVLGAFITMADSPWYRVHARTAAAWGLTPLEDQQLAGLIMWVPAGIVYLVALVPLCLDALAERRPDAPLGTPASPALDAG